MAELLIVKGMDEGRKIPLETGRVVIGRDQTAMVRLSDTEVSRNHAEVFSSKEGFRIRDLGSANGSFVNCKSIQDVLLRPGDQIQIGQTIIMFLEKESHPDAEGVKGELFPETLQKEDFFKTFSLLEKVPETAGSQLLSNPDQAKGPWLRSALVRLGAIYETIQASSQILDVKLLLERILELIVNTIGADRGCFLIRQDSDLSGLQASQDQAPDFEKMHEACRWGAHEDGGWLPVSKTVVDHVLKEKIGVLVDDAPRDIRFSAAQSIISTGVREIICVPVKGRHITLGVLYLDSKRISQESWKSQNDKFFQRDHLALAIAIAHQSALAVEDTIHYRARIQNERLAGVGETVAYLSHHIKNILQGLKSGGEILKLGFTDHDDTLLAQGIKLIEKNHGRIFDLVMDMLNFSKERIPVKTRIDVKELCKEVIELASPLAKEKNVELEFHFCEVSVQCQLDKEGIHRALLNLINNAIDALGEKGYGKVRVSLELNENKKQVLIRVKDDGPGIPIEMKGRMFQPFQSSKGGKGTGLGLAVTHKIISEHQGFIDVESNPVQGTEFCIGLPLID